MITYYIICALVGYLIGSIPFGYIIVKLAKGIDIRTVGSGNIGATNVARVLGLFGGVICFLLDLLKGLIPVIAANILFLLKILPPTDWCDTNEVCVVILQQYSIFYPSIIGLSVILGHLFPVYLRFKGGKGVATALGVFLILAPSSTCIAVIFWILLVLIFRYVSLASILASISLPITYWFISFQQHLLKNANDIFMTGWISWASDILPWVPFLPIMFMCILAPILIIIRHIPNIKRLITGTEPKVNFKRSKDDKTLNL